MFIEFERVTDKDCRPYTVLLARFDNYQRWGVDMDINTGLGNWSILTEGGDVTPHRPTIFFDLVSTRNKKFR